MPSTAQERRIQRLLAKQGETLRKVREDSKWFDQYGPYTIVDERNCVVASGITDLDELERELKKEPV